MFNVGDTVKLLVGSPNLRKGSTYLVTDATSIDVKVEGNPFWKGNSMFSLVKKASDTPARYIVIVDEDGKLAPAKTPREYKTQAHAETVAEEMAKTHGGLFYVFKTTAFVNNPKPVTLKAQKIV